MVHTQSLPIFRYSKDENLVVENNLSASSVLIGLDVVTIKQLRAILKKEKTQDVGDVFAGIFVQPVEAEENDNIQFLVFKDSMPKKVGARYFDEISKVIYSMLYANVKEIRILGSCRLSFSAGVASFSTFSTELFGDPEYKYVKHVGDLIAQQGFEVKYEKNDFDSINEKAKSYSFDEIVELARQYFK